jgi:hypothetical protein
MDSAGPKSHFAMMNFAIKMRWRFLLHLVIMSDDVIVGVALA